MAAAPVAVGDVLAGKYRVEQIVGAGAMGMIVAAWHLELDQRVAMKFLHSTGGDGNVAGDPAERFRREARALARIKSEHVARVLDVGSLQPGMPYMVMEFLEGNNLADEIRARGPMPVVESVAYALQAIEAMAEAHAAGIVHRDLKPANLFLARRPDGERIIKVLDFGISKSLLGISRDELSLTKTAALLGSPLYMSPEQVRSAREVDARTDIWALGVILYEMLTGRTPYTGDSVPQLFSSLLYETPFNVAQLRADVPHDLDAAVMHCLAKERDQRWRNVGDLATALVAFGPPAAHVHAERARRVLGLPDAAGVPPISRPSLPSGGALAAGARVSAPYLPTPGGAQSAGAGLPVPPGGTPGGVRDSGARLSAPHGAPHPASGAETGPTVNSWSQTGNVPRAGRKGAIIGAVVVGGAVVAALSLAAVIFLRSGPEPGAAQPAASAAAAAPSASAEQGEQREAAPVRGTPAAPGATAGAAAPPAEPSAAATAAAPGAAATPAAPGAAATPAAAGAAATPAAPGAAATPAASGAAAPSAASSAAATPPAAPQRPASQPAAAPATAAARPAERPPQPGAGARPQPQPQRDSEISDFGGRR
ncbi:serine/threonine-protein kinase [Sorangium sp. So ce854]|uniref:serine/threonine-protein kinase n=1 Tax=Sorangium sp. So ce854 TaxID=3133322 RepID=UPI003F6484EE